MRTISVRGGAYTNITRALFNINNLINHCPFLVYDGNISRYVYMGALKKSQVFENKSVVRKLSLFYFPIYITSHYLRIKRCEAPVRLCDQDCVNIEISIRDCLSLLSLCNLNVAMSYFSVLTKRVEGVDPIFEIQFTKRCYIPR